MDAEIALSTNDQLWMTLAAQLRFRQNLGMDEDNVYRFEQEHEEAYWIEQEEIERKREALLNCPCGEPLIPRSVCHE